MLTEEEKRAIEALPKEELLLEINKGARSRFQGERHPYLVSFYSLLCQREAEELANKGLRFAEEANKIAAKANEISKEANTTSKASYRMSVFAVVVALIAALIAWLKP